MSKPNLSKRWGSGMVQLFAQEILKLHVQCVLRHPETGQETWVVQTNVDLAEQDIRRRHRRATCPVSDKWKTDEQHDDCKAIALVACLRDLLDSSVLRSFYCDDLESEINEIHSAAQDQDTLT